MWEGMSEWKRERGRECGRERAWESIGECGRERAWERA